MVIDSNNTNILSSGNSAKGRIDAGTGNKSNTAETPSQSVQKPEVSLSSQAQSLNQLESKIHATPDVDTQRVAEIKQALAEGTYEINPERIAERMLAQDRLF
ncbi:flagellar biosynthesis anti-sigma factor FlgM [Aestuariicella sp. G3-2]|uniref:flagellar biosynthesis anti-sigma factor FlgM n=1 Tax=Pseudomaricurvus albidus TaxID=2842452 RepID=UPI001C0E7942|nr:flagellar biosynthesis anti-sigma factor FlgM [Aestuariicella albida]MBU3071144.1 flagellar biosynthesis anti-sigma factor FlgM [Aestuariicella albida]